MSSCSLRKLIEEFTNDFKDICGVSYRQLDEVIEWMFKVFDAGTIRSLDGIKKVKRILNLIYRTEGRTEDLQDWLKLLIDRFEAYMKKIYYLSHGFEYKKEDGSYVQFLDAAKAVNVHRVKFTEDERLFNIKTYYSFIHSQRNEDTHSAPLIEDCNIMPGIHMATAMYLYATMINITDIEANQSE